MQFPIDPHIRDLAFLVGDLPVVAGAAPHLVDSDILASCTWIGGARIAGIGERFDVRPALAPASRHVACMMLHVHLLRWHQDVGGLGLEVSDDDALAAAGTAL